MVKVSNQPTNRETLSPDQIKQQYEAARKDLDAEIQKIKPQIQESLRSYNIKFPVSVNGDFQLSSRQASELLVETNRPVGYDAEDPYINPNAAGKELMTALLKYDAGLDEIRDMANSGDPDDQKGAAQLLGSTNYLSRQVDEKYASYQAQIKGAQKNEKEKMAALSGTYNQQRGRIGEIGADYNSHFSQKSGIKIPANGQISDAQVNQIMQRMRDPSISKEEKHQLNMMVQVDGQLDRAQSTMSKVNERVAANDFTQTPQLREQVKKELTLAQTFTLSNYPR